MEAERLGKVTDGERLFLGWGEFILNLQGSSGQEKTGLELGLGERFK